MSKRIRTAQAWGWLMNRKYLAPATTGNQLTKTDFRVRIIPETDYRRMTAELRALRKALRWVLSHHHSASCYCVNCEDARDLVFEKARAK